MLGRLPRTSGSVKILGPALGPAGEVPRAVRSQIAYLPQSLALQGRLSLTVGELRGLLQPVQEGMAVLLRADPIPASAAAVHPPGVGPTGSTAQQGSVSLSCWHPLDGDASGPPASCPMIPQPSLLNRIARVLLCLVFIHAVIGKLTGFAGVAGAIGGVGPGDQRLEGPARSRAAPVVPGAYHPAVPR